MLARGPGGGQAVDEVAGRRSWRNGLACPAGQGQAATPAAPVPWADRARHPARVTVREDQPVLTCLAASVAEAGLAAGKLDLPVVRQRQAGAVGV